VPTIIEFLRRRSEPIAGDGGDGSDADNFPDSPDSADATPRIA
jgi:hypothetical protein